VKQNSAQLNTSSLDQVLDKLTMVGEEVGAIIVGQKQIIREMQVALMAGGHCLLEGVPGLAKTLMVKTLSECLQLDFSRIQFTPDLMPSDLIGGERLNPKDADMGLEFQPGPVFTQVLLADEINRTPPKTQAALLEAMQEKSVSYAGTTHILPQPFFVLATQNPLEQAGTYPLPEAQLDRFLMLLKVDYPTEQEEFEILKRTTDNQRINVKQLLSAQEILELQTSTRDVVVSDAMLSYAASLVRASRPQESRVKEVTEYVRWGAGPRAGQALILAAKANALLERRFAVTMDDLLQHAAPVLRHRMLLNFKAQAEQLDADWVIQKMIAQISNPSSPLS